MPDGQLMLVLPEHLGAIWDVVGPWFPAACEKNGGYLEPDDYYDDIAEGRMQLWVYVRDGIAECAVVTEVQETPNRRFLFIQMCTGHDRRLWTGAVLTGLEEYARLNGCDSVQMSVRRGWAKMLREEGYKETHVLMERDL